MSDSRANKVDRAEAIVVLNQRLRLTLDYLESLRVRPPLLSGKVRIDYCERYVHVDREKMQELIEEEIADLERRIDAL